MEHNELNLLKAKSYSIFAGSVGATNMNEHSSRSHAIFTITIERSEKGVDGQQHVRMGKLHMVDLAVSIITSLLSLSLMLNLTTLTTSVFFMHTLVPLSED